MEAELEKSVDSFLQSILGGSPPALLISNIVIGAIFLFIALRILTRSTKKKSRNFAWIILIIGSLGMVSGITQCFVKFL